MKVKLTKLFRHDNLPGGTRTDVVEGKCFELPEVGKKFFMIAEALDPEIKAAGGCRTVNTSTVMKLDITDDKKMYTLTTRSESIYTVEFLD